MAYRKNSTTQSQAKVTLPAVLVLCAHFAHNAEAALVEDLSISGYIREGVSVNLADPKISPSDSKDDKYEVSMARTSIRADLTGRISDVDFTVVGRFSREMITDYLSRLEEGGAGNEAMLSTIISEFGIGSPREGDLSAIYDEDAEIREAYFDFQALKNTKVRVGKQIVTFGETDFFQALDVFHGMDLRWRNFLEEPEELYQPLILFNSETYVPALDGTLQVVLRPGLDDEDAIGTRIGLNGGRWAPDGLRTFDVFGSQTIGAPYNLDHPEGDKDDLTGALRWSSTLGSINYQLMWLHQFQPEVVINSRFAPYKANPESPVAEAIYPIVDTFGISANGFVPLGDIVWATEIAYTPDKPYNAGSSPLLNVLDLSINSFQPRDLYLLGGYNGVVKKDTLRSMVRGETTIDLMKYLKTNRPSLFSVQVFDTWIMDFDESDDIVDLPAYSATKSEHSTIVTAGLFLNYNLDRINVGLASGFDVTYGGYFLVPSITFAYGDHWRIKAEADLFYPNGVSLDDTHLFGTLNNSDQLYLRATYQY